MLIYRRILTLCQSRMVWSMLDVMSKLSTPSLLPWGAKPVAGTNLPYTQACKLNLHFSIISFMLMYYYVIPMTTTIENDNSLINGFNHFMNVVKLPWILWIIWKRCRMSSCQTRMCLPWFLLWMEMIESWKYWQKESKHMKMHKKNHTSWQTNETWNAFNKLYPHTATQNGICTVSFQ